MNRTLKIAALAAALAFSGMASARVLAGNGYPNNFSYATSGTYVPITAAAATTLTVNAAKAGRYVLTYSAECAVDAPAGDTSSWVDIDIEVNGTVVRPTLGTQDAFCSANGTLGFDGWVRASVTTTVDLLAGANTVRVLGKYQFNATGGWLGDSAIVVHD